jgi:hypothetical protein
MVKGTPPSPRDSHTCTTVGQRLFVFGGTDGTSPLKDLHILDTGLRHFIVGSLIFVTLLWHLNGAPSWCPMTWSLLYVS